MPQTNSAEKRLRQTAKRTERNRAIMSRVRTGKQTALKAISTGEAEAAQSALNHYYSLLDRARIKGVVTKNYIGREKSRIAEKFNSMSSAPKQPD